MKYAQFPALFATLLLMSCTLGNATGYVPTNAEIAEIQNGVDNADSIEARYGLPAFYGENGSWYYVSSRREYIGSLSTREVERRILAVHFDGAGRVVGYETLGLDEARNIAVSRHITDTGGRKLSLWEQMRGAVGNFSAERFISDVAQ